MSEPKAEMLSLVALKSKHYANALWYYWYYFDIIIWYSPSVNNVGGIDQFGRWRYSNGFVQNEFVEICFSFFGMLFLLSVYGRK